MEPMKNPNSPLGFPHTTVGGNRRSPSVTTVVGEFGEFFIAMQIMNHES